MDTKKLSLASSCPLHTRNMHDSWTLMCLVYKNMYLGFTRHINQALGQIWENKCYSTFVIPAVKTCCWFNVGEYFFTALFAIFWEVAFSRSPWFSLCQYGFYVVTSSSAVDDMTFKKFQQLLFYTSCSSKRLNKTLPVRGTENRV